MTDFPTPPFALWSRVGHHNAVWTVCGLCIKVGYQVVGWEYWLCHPGEHGLTENDKVVKCRDDELITVHALLEERERTAGKYAAETQRIAKEAAEEHARLVAQVKGSPQ